MRKRTYLYILCCLLTSSCFVKKKTTYGKQQPTITVNATEPGVKNDTPKAEPLPYKNIQKANAIISTALTYSGVKYRFGGNTKKGIDCSGLLYVSFKKHQIDIPRVSYLIADEGKNIKVRNINKGDLLFFKTSRKAKKINHVGMVVSVKGKEIKFIHATSSRGVIVSSLREGYWNHAFIKATRIL